MRCEDYGIEDEPVVTVEEEIEHIVDWIKYYFVRNGADSKAIIGISGGKDSTVAAALCVKALGADRVIGILIPEGKQDDIDKSYYVKLVDEAAETISKYGDLERFISDDPLPPDYPLDDELPWYTDEELGRLFDRR